MAETYNPKAPTVDVSLDSKIEVRDFRDDIVQQVRDEHKYGFDVKRGLYKNWSATEDEYYGRIPLSLDSRFQVPFPFMSGFIDTYKSKIDDPFVLKFGQTRDAGYRAALKVQDFYEQQSTDEDADWESKDLDTKFYALLYGRGIDETYPEVLNRKFKFCIETVDPYDFYDEFTKGGNLEAHDFCGVDGMLKSKYQLLELAAAGYYDKRQVSKLLIADPNKTQKVSDEWFIAKQNRLITVGLDHKTYMQAGQAKYKLIKSGTTYKGERWMVTWNRETGIWVRCVRVKDIRKSGLWDWTSWSPKREAHNSWPLAPSDDFRPVAVAMKVFLNQELDNRNKKNWDMRAYDPDMFPEPAELDWRPGGLVAIKSGATRTRRIDSGIYRFETADLSGTINMIDYLDNMTGTKLGITNATQGQAKEDKVGIFFGNQQAVADRIEFTAKQYRKAQVAKGRRFVWAIYQYLPEPQAVQILGDKGLGWDKLRKAEIDPTIKIRIEGGNVQAQMDEIKAKKKTEALTAIGADPAMAASVNPKWRAEQLLRAGEVPAEEIIEAMDTQDYGQKELMAKAAEAIEDLANGKYPPMCYDANTAFIKKLMNAAFADKADLKPVVFDRIIAYANAHIPIAASNAARMAALQAAKAGANPTVDMVTPANQGAQPPMQPGQQPTPTLRPQPKVPATAGVVPNA